MGLELQSVEGKKTKKTEAKRTGATPAEGVGPLEGGASAGSLRPSPMRTPRGRLSGSVPRTTRPA